MFLIIFPLGLALLYIFATIKIRVSKISYPNRIKYDDLAEPQKLPKDELLSKLEESEKELIEILSNPEIGKKKVKVPWSKEPIPAASSLWGLDSHEILHQGWNLAIMDHLNIERFPALKAMWG